MSKKKSLYIIYIIHRNIYENSQCIKMNMRKDLFLQGIFIDGP